MRIADTEYSIAPRNDPLVYPGRIPSFSFLYLGEYFFKLQVSTNRRLGQTRIIWDPERPPEIRIRDENENLDNRLLRLNATSVEFRYPIVALGSNASPSQLQRKYQGRGVSTAIPVFRATLHGIDAVYSAHMSSYGAIPAAPVASDGAQVEIHVTFVDQLQLRILDETEPNYIRVRVDGSRFPLLLESTESLSEYYMYLSRHGVLCLDGELRRLDAIPARQSSVVSCTEEEILSQIVGRWNQFFPDRKFTEVTDILRSVKEKSDLLNELKIWIKANFSRSNVDIPVDIDHEPHMYRDIIPGRSEIPQDRMFTVIPNYDRKQGDYATAVHPSTRAVLGLNRYVVLERALDDERISLISELSSRDTVKNEAEIHVDQTIRNGLGVEIGEGVRLYKLHEPGVDLIQRLLDKILPKRYVIMRVQVADILIMEKASCTMPSIALGLLGVEPGDKVVLESPIRKDSRDEYRLERVTLRAYPAPLSMLELRDSVQSGKFVQTRFPECAEVLGVFPDLPWIFVDADARDVLRLSKCSPVRVHAKRRYQISKDYRNYALLIIVTLLSAISLLDTAETIPIPGLGAIPLNLCLILPGILICAVLIFLALRSRFT
jgi:hypothetical protein